jgi:hypothetical protein
MTMRPHRPAGNDGTPADDAAPARNPLRGEVRRSVIKKVIRGSEAN